MSARVRLTSSALSTDCRMSASTPRTSFFSTRRICWYSFE